ncbi:MAG: glycosyltransferase [Fusobacteriaceae bacterium]
MKVSVIVTVYNRISYLRNMITCLNLQTKKPYELIIADDGSQESIEELLNEFPNLEYKVKHVYQSDRGFRLAASRNNGAREAEGDYLIFLDQDIIFDETLMETIEKQVEKSTFLKMKAIYVNEEVKEKIEKRILRKENYQSIILEANKEQMRVNESRYRKDSLYVILYKLGLRKRAAKIVGLGFGLYKEDYYKINGFDENYEGWGYEDDDFGNRLTFSGIYGIPLKTKYPMIHMYHKEAPTKGKSLNEDYYKKQRREHFKKKSLYCNRGVINGEKS